MQIHVMLFRFGSYIQLSKVNKLGMGIKYIVMYNILFYDLLKGKQKCSKPRISTFSSGWNGWRWFHNEYFLWKFPSLKCDKQNPDLYGSTDIIFQIVFTVFNNVKEVSWAKAPYWIPHFLIINCLNENDILSWTTMLHMQFTSTTTRWL